MPTLLTRRLVDERCRRLSCVCPGRGVVERGRQGGCTFVEEAELVAQKCGVGGAGLPGQLDQALDVGAFVIVDDVVNLRHDLGRLDGGVVEGAAAHLPAGGRGFEQGEYPLARCLVGGVRAGTDGVTDAFLNASQVLLDDRGLTRKMLIKGPLDTDASLASRSTPMALMPSR